MLILHAAGVGLTDRPAVISGRYNKIPLTTATEPLRMLSATTTHTHSCKPNYAELVMGMIMGFEALYAGRGRRNPV